MSLLKVSYQSEDSQSLHYISSLRRKIGKGRVRYPREETRCQKFQLAEEDRIRPQDLILPRTSHTMGFPSQYTQIKQHYMWT